MLKFILLLIFDALVLQPIRILLGFPMRFLWKPPKTLLPVGEPLPWPDLAVRADQLYQTLDRNKYGIDDDSAKFLGMLTFVRPETEWANLMRLVDNDGNVKRNLKDPYPDDTPDFSSDMLSGFMLGVYGNLGRMSDEEREKLTKVWEKASWQGFPMLISSANCGKSLFKRGHVYRFWWVFGCEEILMCLAWLALGFELTGKFKYKAAYWIMMVLLFPSLILTCPDAQVFLGKYYMLSAHNTHSRALINFVGEQITSSIWFRKGLNVAFQRHGAYNADIALLYIKSGSDWSVKEYVDIPFDAAALISSALIKGLSPCPKDREYIELGLPPEKKQYSANFMPPEMRGNDYVWERSPIYGYAYNDASRKAQGLDVIFPVGLALRG